MSDLEKRAEDTWNLLATSPDVVHKVLVDALRTERRLAFDEAATRLQEMIDADTICISPDEIRALGEKDDD